MIAGLIGMHLMLGHREEAVRLILPQVREPNSSREIISVTRGAIRLDSLYSGIRNDRRIQALLKDDAAWVVK